MKKTLSLMLVLTLILSFAGIPAFAADADIAMLTLDDSRDFTVVGNENDVEEMKVVGLTSSYQKIEIENKEGIVWTTSDEQVAKFLDEDEEPINTVSGKDKVKVVLKGAGRATITASLEGKTIDSYILVEKLSDNPTAKNIHVKIIGKTIEKVDSKDLTIKNTSLKEVFGENFDDTDVLKENASALHALIQALEEKNGKEWVKNNVVVKNEGGYVEKIDTDDSSTDWSNGWQYTVNGNEQNHAASIYELKDGDTVVWEFKGWKY
ncbi:DUF4430 domain-containing protein [Anaerophilus nitritogenes]|uniref:DUF4430 domain-containing protein n=1 Tax=Anaerophilus nitritogenes TaxID=2498136 RepID=UPI0013ED1332|nr:DUF4430 domain-containing protein [Anaerophilus nitritogenes]